ncbi:AAA family ATPase [Paenibacillus sp. N3.4]|uniref:AAA family ATPase n=1 Tax=Paenibacillus sp. N3.4 TaxID=2603222 RepID=UPI0011C87346|nr:SMC family ATPase [Paenibacillus sp. N3.4]TXK84099.1 SMC family ATPase [Paenibacillus sp. N3.4]
MRPIQLQISGLQSYRELQTIEFGQLVDAGVFGIFGPTGSGKSSILDAITLSLYGKVERASGGTQAIMNQAEQTLFVSFTFELTNAAGTERYRVERQFKRGTEQSINGTITRLLHLRDNETIVLADKAGEVNQQVYHILGLSMQDFTRAVVLPQGKFAEFLTLTGKDRRQMLQRLFHLERYGDHLSAKVSSCVKETDSTIKQLAAEQQGLGDASNQALEEAQARLVEAEQEAVRSRNYLQQTEILYEEHKQVFQWQSEQASLANEVLKQQEQEQSIREKEQLLQQAEQAEKVVPYLQQFAVASKELLTGQDQLDAALHSQRTAETTYQQATLTYDHAQQELASQEGPLLLRVDQLQQALVIQQELNQVQAQIEAAQRQEGEAKSHFTALQTELAKNLETKQKAILKQAELKEQLALIETNAVARQLTQAASQEKQVIMQLKTQEQEASQNQKEKEALYKDLEQNHVQLVSKQKVLQQRLSMWQQQSQALSDSLLVQRENLTRFIPFMQANIDEQKMRWKTLERHALAASLAHGLLEGEPCPVCGATEHPLFKQPNDSRSAEAVIGHSETATTGSIEELLQHGEEILQKAKERQYAHQQLQRRMASSYQQAIEMSVFFPAQQRDATEQLNKGLYEAAVTQEEKKGSAELNMDAALQTWRALEEATGSCHSDVDHLEQDFHMIQKDCTGLEQQFVQVRTQQQTAADLLAEANRRLVAVTTTLTEQTQQWRERFIELSWDTIEQQLEQLLANERLADELRGRIEKSIPFLDGLAAKMEELQRAAMEQDRAALQLHERLQGLAQFAADKSRQLALRAPVGDVPQLMAEATATLERLRLLAQQAKHAHAAALAEQFAATQRYSAAAEAAAAATRQLAHTERALHGALEENGFASREARKQRRWRPSSAVCGRSSRPSTASAIKRCARSWRSWRRSCKAAC